MKNQYSNTLNKRSLSGVYFNAGVFIGWAYDPFLPFVEMALYEKDKILASSISDLELDLEDLIEVGRPPKTKCGYRLQVPSHILDGRLHNLNIKVLNWKLELDPKPITIDFIYGEANGEVFIENGFFIGNISFNKPQKNISPVLIYKNPYLPPIAQIMPIPSENAIDGYTKAAFKLNANGFDSSIVFKYIDSILTYNKKTNDSKIVGAVYDITKDYINGFIVDVNAPYLACNVCLFIDGLLIKIIRPDRKSPTVSESLNIDIEEMGNCVFNIQTPKILLDGKTHLISMVSKDSNLALTNGEKEICFPIATIPLDSILSDNIKKKLTVSSKNVKPIVSIIILNRNGENILPILFESWQKYNSVACEIIIIDHASSDKSLTIIQDWSQALDIKVLSLDYNDSFSASCNMGASIARAKYLLFLNNDIIWTNDALPQMMESLNDDMIGIVGIKLIQRDGSLLNEVQHLGIRIGLYQNAYWPYEITPDCDSSYIEYSKAICPAVTGAVMLCKKDNFDRICGFNEDYFYGFEDVEICLRMKKLIGKKSLCLNNISALHMHGYTRLSGREKSVINRQEHNVNIFSAHHGLWLKQKARSSLFEEDCDWSAYQIHIAFVTADRLNIGESANIKSVLELAKALGQKFKNAKVLFLTPDINWYDVYGLDILISCDKTYDLRLLKNKKASLVCVAYEKCAINFEAWRNMPWWDKYDIYGSSDLQDIKSFQYPIIEFSATNIDLLISVVSSQLRVAILVPVSKKNKCDSDLFKIASGFCKYLKTVGVKAEPICVEDWDIAPFVVDVYIQIFTFSANMPSLKIRNDAVNVLWILSDIETIDKTLIQKYDIIFVASDFLQKQAKENGFDVTICYPEFFIENTNYDIELKKYIILGSQKNANLPPVLYPNVYYVLYDSVYPNDDKKAKIVEIYSDTSNIISHKVWIAQSYGAEVKIGIFTNMKDVINGHIELKNWSAPKNHDAKYFFDVLQNKLRKKVGYSIYTS